MASAADGLAHALAGVRIDPPRVPVVSNVDATLNTDPEASAGAARPAGHRFRSVGRRRCSCCRRLGCVRALEIGPGQVLAKLLQRMQLGIARSASAKDRRSEWSGAWRRRRRSRERRRRHAPVDAVRARMADTRMSDHGSSIGSLSSPARRAASARRSRATWPPRARTSSSITASAKTAADRVVADIVRARRERRRHPVRRRGRRGGRRGGARHRCAPWQDRRSGQ